MAYLYSDNRIALVRYHINAIFKKCFNVDDAVVTQKFSEPLESSMFRLCKDDDTIARFPDLVPEAFKFMMDQQESSEEQKESRA